MRREFDTSELRRIKGYDYRRKNKKWLLAIIFIVLIILILLGIIYLFNSRYFSINLFNQENLQIEPNDFIIEDAGILYFGNISDAGCSFIDSNAASRDYNAAGFKREICQKLCSERMLEFKGYNCDLDRLNCICIL
ncbi:MAG: hypothetical protein PHF67_01795 [Candidatus Nanoarchaeia archaeon]|nr:hypothetical protein [Candidatus Nanoarchaeia archaeon]